VGTTDTVVDNTHDWRARSLFPFGPPTAPDNPPTAQITSANCVGLTCSFTGSGSDPDGDPLTYAWSFGDGSPNASGAVAQHIYPSSGTYTVTLSVSDGRGGTGTATTTVSPQGTTAQIAFDGQQSFNSPTTNVQNPSVNVPGQPGDTVLLFASVNAVGTTNTTPAGWTQVSQFSNGNLQTTVYQHQAAAGDPSTVIVHLDAGARVDLQAVAYTGVGSVSVTNAGDSSTNTHVTPTAPVLAPSSWAVSYWADRTSAGQETWSLPGAVVQRGLDAPASGGGRVDSAIADSNGGVPVGSYGGQTATVTTADGTVAGKGDTSTVILAPAIT
jgi:PKD repeat protein